MWSMYVFNAPAGDGQAVLVTDNDAIPCFFGTCPHEAATWLGAVGQDEVWVETAGGGEHFAVVKRAPAALPRHAVARPRALLVPAREADAPVRDAAEALAAVARYQARRFARPRRRHRRTEGPYRLASG